MKDKKKILALIPAREGSKGLPGKNIRNLHGKPLILWTLDLALQSKYIDKVIVSTDSNEIIRIVESRGNYTPFKRPDYLATDTAKSIEVVEHTIDYLNKLNEIYDYLILLEPTSPLRELNDIDESIEILFNSNFTSLVSISQVISQHPQFLYTIREEKNLRPYISSDKKVTRRQDLDNLYYIEGSIYISEIKELLLKKTFYHNKTIGYEVPKWKSFEIDDETDFYIISALMLKEKTRYGLSK